jgi:hypothetical protein
MRCSRALPREPFRVQHSTRSLPARIVASASKPAVRLHLHLHLHRRLRVRVRRQAAAEGLDSLSAAIPSRISLTRLRPGPGQRQVALRAQHHVSWAARLPHTVAACLCLHTYLISASTDEYDVGCLRNVMHITPNPVAVPVPVPRLSARLHASASASLDSTQASPADRYASHPSPQPAPC